MAKTQYWMVDDTGTYARADGVEERDRWLPRSFVVADEEPSPNAFVWVRHPEIQEPARLPAQSLDAWSAQGWLPSVPNEPESPFNGPALPVTSVSAFVEPTPESAASGSTKNKEK